MMPRIFSLLFHRTGEDMLTRSMASSRRRFGFAFGNRRPCARPTAAEPPSRRQTIPSIGLPALLAGILWIAAFPVTGSTSAQTPDPAIGKQGADSAVPPSDQSKPTGVTKATRWIRQTLGIRNGTVKSPQDAESANAATTAPQLEAADRIRPRHGRVTWTKDPVTHAMVAWNTILPGTTHQLRWRKRGAAEFQTTDAISGAFSYADKEPDGLPLYYHNVELSDLQPGTAYEVQFVSDQLASEVFHFITAPGGDKPFSLLFGADSRTDRTARRAMNRMIADAVSNSQLDADPANHIYGLMHGGDYAVRGTTLSLWFGWMEDSAAMVTASNRLIPVIPARGNHDRGRLFNECFGFKVRDEHNWYGISFGSLLRVITLNTEASIAGDQARWLRNELIQSSPTHRWVVPQYHRPGYAGVKSPSGALAHWVPLFEEFNVKLVCEGDGHIIKRTVPIRRGKTDATGVVYIGEGGLGVAPRDPKPKRWFLKSPGMCSSGHHLQRLTFTPDRMAYECVISGEKGLQVIDRWESGNPAKTANQE